ncbi:MAG: hypothetical protein E7163_01185 [Firmicutes bacterium]|nr:hypothetical protein [Bacillota bacterium]
MDKEIKFRSLQELYDRILPALKSKTRELNKKGFNYIHEEDIWNFLKTYKWTSSRDLDLAAMVNDIFNLNDKEIDEYVRNEIKGYRRTVNSDDFLK